ncbi:protein FAM98B isoform X2 [Agrilus planipennis]|uniref:Protein FAM98B isoform X2 n=1 Tax=Agrilus planipennis TaxID=224129 RepID=A0A1W4XUA7_AGRPL|nr:protein FAM98B isoform X2 [Agrilus planipennis]
MTNKKDAIFDLIKEIGYTGPLLDKIEFYKAIEEGPKSIEFSCLVSYLCSELRLLADLDECVNPMATTEDSISFILEVSSLLKESGCPYSSLIHGHASDRFATVDDRLLLLDYLITEVMAARILEENKPAKKLELKLNETPQAADLRKILQTLGFSRPPPNITVQTLIQKLTQSIQNTISKANPDLIGNSLFNGMLSEAQWDKLNDVHKELQEDYTIRRETLLKRLDCTVQSFQWSDKTKGKEELFEDVYEKKRKILKSEPDVDISDLLAARDDLAVIEKTSNSTVRKNTQSAISKVIIGKVPDRGGRTSEQAPPPPEMPSWQQRTAGPPPGGRGGRGGGGGRQQGRRGGGQQQSSGSFNKNSFGGSSGSLNRSGGGYDNAGSYGGNVNYQQGKSDYSRGGGSSYSRGGSDVGKGGSDYNRGGNDYNRGGNYFNQGGSNYNRGGHDDNRGGNNYNREGNDYNRGGNDYSRGGNDYNQGESNYNRGRNDYNQGGSGYYRRGENDYNRGGSDYGRSSAPFDSAGSYEMESRTSANYNEPKRQKTYEQFQQNKSTYADQYVQESRQNQQYRPRNENTGGRGRSNYNRGGYR